MCCENQWCKSPVRVEVVGGVRGFSEDLRIGTTDAMAAIPRRGRCSLATPRLGRGRAVGASHQQQSSLCRRPPNTAEFGARGGYNTVWVHSDVVKTILGQFKIKVDDLKHRSSQAKRDKPFEGRSGVAVKDGQRFVASKNSAILCRYRDLVGLARKAKGWQLGSLRRVNRSARWSARAEDGETNTNSTRLTTDQDGRRQARPGDRPARRSTTIEVLARRKRTTRC